MLLSKTREELSAIKEEYEEKVTEPMHSLLTDKEDKTEAVNKHEERKHKTTAICPQACSGRKH